MTESNISYSVEITRPEINFRTDKETDSFNKVFLFPLVHFFVAYSSQFILEPGRLNFPCEHWCHKDLFSCGAGPRREGGCGWQEGNQWNNIYEDAKTATFMA